MHFKNKQLGGAELVSSTFQNINVNSNDANKDFIDLYAKNKVLSDQLVEIIDQTKIDPGKDPEVTNARNSAKNGEFPTVKARLDEGEKLPKNWYLDLENAYGNTKLIADFQDFDNMGGYNNARTKDLEHKLLYNYSMKMSELDNVDTNIYSDIKDLDLDLNKFNNSSVSNDDDYIRLVFYISNIAKTFKVALFFDIEDVFTDNDIVYHYINKDRLVQGWNFINIKKSQFLVKNNGNFDSIHSCRVFWTSTIDSQNEYVSFQNIQLIKNINDIPNPFGNDVRIDAGEWYVGYEFDNLILKNLNRGINHNYPILYKPEFSNCIASLRSYTTYKYGAYNRGLTLYTNYRQFITCYITSNILSLLIVKNGTTERILSCDFKIDCGDIVNYKLKKLDSNITLECVNNGNLKTLELSIDYPEKVCIGLSVTSNIDMIYKSLSITEIDSQSNGHTHHSDIAEVAKSLRPQDYGFFDSYGNAQSILGIVVTPLLFNNLVKSDGIELINSGFRITKSGVYTINCSCVLTDVCTGYLCIVLNSKDVVWSPTSNVIGYKMYNNNAPNMNVTINTICKLTAGDIIYPVIKSNINTTVNEGTYGTFIKLTKVGE